MTDRHHRQTILPGFGPEAQDRLGAAHVMIIGIGALGCPAADLLVRAGVGRISLLDRDTVELTNLQRQTLYAESDVGSSKAIAAARRLGAVNSQTRLEPIVEDFTPESAEPLLLAHPRPDVILDCTDTFHTRYLINDAAVKHSLPLVYGAAIGTQGMQMTLWSRSAVLESGGASSGGSGSKIRATPCLRCLFPDPPASAATPTCDTAGVFGPVCAIVGAAQAADAVKVIVAPGSLSGSLLRFDLWSNQRTRLDISKAKDPSCPCCVLRKFEYLEEPFESEPTVLCGRNAVQIPSARSATDQREAVDLKSLAIRLAQHGHFAVQDSTMLTGTLLDGTPLTLFRDGRVIVGNTTDPARARSIAARYLGR